MFFSIFSVHLFVQSSFKYISIPKDKVFFTRWGQDGINTTLKPVRKVGTLETSSGKVQWTSALWLSSRKSLKIINHIVHLIFWVFQARKIGNSSYQLRKRDCLLCTGRNKFNKLFKVTNSSHGCKIMKASRRHFDKMWITILRLIVFETWHLNAAYAS